MSTIDDVKNLEAKWSPIYVFDVVLKDGTPRYWSTRPCTFGGNTYEAIILRHSPLTVEGVNLYGVDAVMQIALELNNADLNLNSLIAPSNWQGGTIQPRFIFVNPRTGDETSDCIVYPKFLIDLPSETFPRVIFQAHNKFNMARKTLPLSRITKHDRYPFPDTAAERLAAGSDPTSEFFACGYDPDNGKGNYKTGSTPYQRADYNGLRDSEGPGTQVSLKTIGLSVRYGGFGKLPGTVSYTPKKGQRADFPGNANESKYGKPVPLVFGTVRITPIVLDTGSFDHWNGARLSHLLLCDGVNFGPEATMGIEDVLDVYLTGVKGPAGYWVPKTSGQAHITGSWSFQSGYFGMQWGTDTASQYRNLNLSTDFPDVEGLPADFKDRDPYSGLAVLNLGIPKEFAGDPSGIGPKVEAVVKGLRIETWGDGPSYDVTWQWTDNPVWIYIHLLKLLGWSVDDDIDKQAAYNAAAFCDQFPVQDSGTAESGTGSTLTDTNRAWATNSWKGFTVVITGGTGNGQSRTIASNTGTVLTVTSSWGTNPDATSEYEIQSTKKRFRCNLAITEPTKADDVLRGIRNNCRMYTSWGDDGKLQIRIKGTWAQEALMWS